MIKEDYVSFEIAKLLKDKGFDEPTLYHYCQNNNFPTHTIDYECIKNSEDAQFCSAPTIQMAMKWLREVHNIFIQVELYSKYNDYCFELFRNTHRLILKKHETYNIYEEACEAAIKYVLENLIKK